MPKSDQGVGVDRFSIIPRALVFVTRRIDGEDQVLLIKGAPAKRLWANRYNGVGGHIERGEDALSAAKRELREETGLVGVDLRLVGTVMIDAGEPRGIGLFVFCGEYAGGTLTASAEGQLEWVAVNALAQYPLVEDLQNLLPRVLHLQSSDPPFSALYYYDAEDRMQIVFGE